MRASNSSKQVGTAKGKQMLKQYIMRSVTFGFVALAALVTTPSHAGNLLLSDSPLFLEPTVPPLNMLVVGRDHKLYYEAYNDASDLNGDGVLDVGYKGYLANDAGGIDYYGYFDSYKCYTYSTDKFVPSSFTANKRCSNAWSGDFLNYLTMSRIDALRKVLYGGKRAVDTDSETVLVRSHIPMDAHSWGKEYASDAPYDIADFAPLTRPDAGRRHLFANTTPNVGASNWTQDNGPPLLRVLRNRTYRIWEWVSKESPVAGTTVSPPSGDVTVTIDNDYQVRVQVCVPNLIGTHEACKPYQHQNYKPFGLLHEFGENDSMLFGLLTGSYTANKSGGVLRKNVGSITDEINPVDGTLTDTVGIIRTLDRLRVAAYTRYTGSGGTSYDCGLPAMARGPITDGSCRMWGNPVAEMMYETLRYFRGRSSGTAAFTAVKGSNYTDVETTLGLPRADWVNPYTADRPVCTKPFQTVMADINNSYDSDQLPGKYSGFALESGSDAVSDTLADTNLAPAMNVSDLATEITDNEPGIRGLRFIGQSGATYDGSPRPKTVDSLASVRGLAPEEPTKQGSYYPASVAYYGMKNRANARTRQKVQTFAVALASPLPKIEIPVGDKKITLVPFAKSVQYNSEINRTEGQFQPTNQIVDFYVENIAADGRSGSFQVNFEDVEAGNDHDMDAIVRYSYRMVNATTLEVELSSDYQAGGIIHHIGYVISGTTADGVYLVVQDCNKNSSGGYDCNGSDPNYFLDVPNDNNPLPGRSVRQFTVNTAASSATLLRDPLWYAAKWGGFEDRNGNGIPDRDDEWDADHDGKPDNYFLVTNALTLSQQLRETFNEIINRSSSASAASVNSGAISTTTRIYQAKFDTDGWTGTLSAFGLNNTGTVNPTAVWEASAKIPSAGDRKIYTMNSDNTVVPFTWDTTGIDATRRLQLNSNATEAQKYLNFIRGANVVGLRQRATPLGDIVSSAPIYVGPPRGRYSDDLEAHKYSTFVNSKRERMGVVYVGANDGMLHAFKADEVLEFTAAGNTEKRRVDDSTNVPDAGKELFAYIPKTVFGNLRTLTRTNYSHKYFVDGSPNSADVHVNGGWRTVLVGGMNLGGQGIYALDITTPEPDVGGLGANSVMWEINDRTSADFADLGFTYSQPAIVRLHDGTWGAVFGNGYNNTFPDGTVSSTGNGVLYIVNIANGQLLRKFDTRQGIAQDPTGAGRPNGLATPTLVDQDGDRIVDFAYVGDLFGNVWKIDLSSTSANSWDFAFHASNGDPQPFFVTTDDGTNTDADADLEIAAQRQPITSRIEVARGPYGAGVMVLFGTGKFLEPEDKVILPRADQTFYALLDPLDGTRIVGRSDLVEQTIEEEYQLGEDDAATTTVNERNQLNLRGRRTSNRGMMGKGWYLDLVSPANGYEGERVITDPIVRDDRVIFNTLIPNNDVCGYGGRSWTMALDLLSGGRLPDGQFDTNGDGVIDGDDDPDVSGVTNQDNNGGILSRPAGLRCLDDSCATDNLMSSSTNGTLDQRLLRSLTGARGRQSWRQIR
ncbi:pilus assembly protein [Steroidobacter flavus]|uniref:Pilus assembly protein n=1 Tax=Steroidobacter flavus TaxID=1842136 RepID=A0ABV8SYU4_9GAMM